MLSSQRNRIEPLPQADGDSRPFDTHGASGPTLVHAEKSGPAFSLLQKRDAALTSLVEPMARLLYRAMQVQALGAIDYVLFDDLPVATKGQLIADAREALHRQSTLYRDIADRAVRRELSDWLDMAKLHYAELNPSATDAQKAERQKAIDHVAQNFQILGVAKFVMDAYHRAMTTPLTMSARSQETLTVVRGARDGF